MKRKVIFAMTMIFVLAFGLVFTGCDEILPNPLRNTRWELEATQTSIPGVTGPVTLNFTSDEYAMVAAVPVTGTELWREEGTYKIIGNTVTMIGNQFALSYTGTLNGNTLTINHLFYKEIRFKKTR
jgi:hypothetical protein